MFIDQATGAELVGGLSKRAVSSAEMQLGRATVAETQLELVGRRVEPLKMSEDPAKVPFPVELETPPSATKLILPGPIVCGSLFT